jgi:pimeloyl-ACP methyl ester carboxylesterase
VRRTSTACGGMPGNGSSDLRDHIGDIGVPTTIIVAADDMATDITHAGEMQQRIPGLNRAFRTSTDSYSINSLEFSLSRVVDHNHSGDGQARVERTVVHAGRHHEDISSHEVDPLVPHCVFQLPLDE